MNRAFLAISEAVDFPGGVVNALLQPKEVSSAYKIVEASPSQPSVIELFHLMGKSEQDLE